jgi:hypothetical protein
LPVLRHRAKVAEVFAVVPVEKGRVAVEAEEEAEGVLKAAGDVGSPIPHRFPK